MGGVPEMVVMEARQQDAPLHLLQSAEEPDPTTRRLFPHPTGDIHGQHGPSLGKTPDPCGDFEPVILTGSRTSQRERTFD
jgi:hypothetical protein